MTMLSGFCNPSNPMESHDRCTMPDCVCIHHRMATPVNGRVPDGDEVDALATAVETLADALPALIDGCTDPEATDLADLFDRLQQARKRLQDAEREAEVACAKAMLGDDTETPTLRVERYRSTDRKSWDHDQWKHDVRAKAVQAHGLKGAQGVLSADGEVLPASVLFDALTTVQAAHAAAAPKTTALKALGLDARDYCEASPGAWHVRVTRMATKGGGNDVRTDGDPERSQAVG